MKLYWHYVMLHLKSLWQYKTSTLLLLLGQFLVAFNLFLGMWFLFQRFHQVADFILEEVVLCFSIVLLQFSLAEMFGRGFDSFPILINKGELDRMMVRPKSLMLQVLGAKFEISRIGRILQALITFLAVYQTIPWDWGFLEYLTLFFMLVGGSAVFMGMFILYASFCFFTIEGLEFFNIFTDGAREFGSYPLAIYGRRILQFTTVVIPYALTQYYPLLLLTHKTDQKWFALLPLVAMLFLVPCIAFWCFGVHHYRSSGS